MEYYGNTLCISHTELIAGIMTEDTVKNLRRRKQIKQVQRACYGTPALFAVESLPLDRKSTRLNSSHPLSSRMPSSA